MSLACLNRDAGGYRLFVSGVVDDGGGEEEDRALVLLSPDEPGFWAHLKAQPEFRDGADDPVDRWSRRVIGALAEGWKGEALLPFGGPPWHPFYQYALRSGRAFVSPVRLLVHDRMGLFASWRGAVRVRAGLARDAIRETPATQSPCPTCAAPCLEACPAGALDASGYDLDRCHAFLDRPEGEHCLKGGCLVRRACPVSQGYGRLAEQSAWHMRHFHP